MKRSFALTVMLSLLLTACSVFPGSVLPTPTPAPSQTPAVPTPQDAPILPPKGALEAQKALAQVLNVPLEEIKISSINQVDWPDGCLGLATPAMTCMAVITPGFQIILDHNGRQYEYRSDREGGVVLPAGMVLDRTEDLAPVVQAVAKHLDVNPDQLKLVRVEPVEWPSPCLGYINPAELCAQVVTPGFNVTLQQSDQVFEVHTDASLTHARLPGGIELLAE